MKTTFTDIFGFFSAHWFAVSFHNSSSQVSLRLEKMFFVINYFVGLYTSCLICRSSQD